MGGGGRRVMVDCGGERRLGEGWCEGVSALEPLVRGDEGHRSGGGRSELGDVMVWIGLGGVGDARGECGWVCRGRCCAGGGADRGSVVVRRDKDLRVGCMVWTRVFLEGSVCVAQNLLAPGASLAPFGCERGWGDRVDAAVELPLGCCIGSVIAGGEWRCRRVWCVCQWVDVWGGNGVGRAAGIGEGGGQRVGGWSWSLGWGVAGIKGDVHACIYVCVRVRVRVCRSGGVEGCVCWLCSGRCVSIFQRSQRLAL